MARDDLIINLTDFSIEDLDDVIIESPTSGEVLVYDEDLSGWVNESISQIAISGDFYTKTETDDLLDDKSDTGHTHDDYALSGHVHDEYATSGHIHDDRYYTEDESDGLFEASGTMSTHEGTYVHGDIASNSAHRNTTTGNPHNIDAADAGADPAGTAASAVSAHESSYDHDAYDVHVASGEIHRRIDDSGYGAEDLWSAEKISGELDTISGGGSTQYIDDLLDVDTAGVISGEILKFDGSQWLNAVDTGDAGDQNIDGGRADTVYFVQNVDGGAAASF